MILSEDLKKARSDRPDEWTMDRFINKAEKLEALIAEAARTLEGCRYSEMPMAEKLREALLD